MEEYKEYEEEEEEEINEKKTRTLPFSIKKIQT